MSALPQILVTGLTLGAMYALATLGLSLTWGALRMLNMAHGAFLAVGGYVAYGTFSLIGLPVSMAFLASAAVGGAFGWLLFWGLAKPMLSRPGYETNIIISTVGLGIILENLILKIFGGQPYRQPLAMPGSFDVFGVAMPFQNVVVVGIALVIVILVQLFLHHTRAGRVVRACSQQRDAAQLLGMPVMHIFAITLAISGALTAVSGVLLSSITQLSPQLGTDPMLKAFIMCVLAGLGNISGSIVAAFLLALLEVGTQYWLGARWGFPVLLGLVIVTLIWRPNGLFSRGKMVRQ